MTVKVDKFKMMDKRMYACALLTVVLVTLVSLYPTVHNGFVNWDDSQYVIENEAITVLTPAHIDFDRALSIKPDYADAYNNRGNAWRGLTEYGRAIADYSAALRFNPDLADTYYNRAVTYFLVKDYTAAVAD
jgi:tetratricopeptide (TPR) repeat protein